MLLMLLMPAQQPSKQGPHISFPPQQTTHMPPRSLGICAAFLVKHPHLKASWIANYTSYSGSRPCEYAHASTSSATPPTYRRRSAPSFAFLRSFSPVPRSGICWPPAPHSPRRRAAKARRARVCWCQARIATAGVPPHTCGPRSAARL